MIMKGELWLSCYWLFVSSKINSSHQIINFLCFRCAPYDYVLWKLTELTQLSSTLLVFKINILRLNWAVGVFPLIFCTEDKWAKMKVLYFRFEIIHFFCLNLLWQRNIWKEVLWCCFHYCSACCRFRCLWWRWS